MSKQIKKVFLEHLPKGEGYGVNKNQINWNKTLNYKVRFIYDDIEGYLEIINYIRKNNKGYLIIEYNKKRFEILANDFKNCKIGRILNKNTSEFKIKVETIFKDEKRDIIITDNEYRKDKNGWNIKWYKYTCKVCGWTEGWKRESDLITGYGCTCCSGDSAVLGINSIIDISPWMIPIIDDVDFCKTHTSNCMDKIYTICPDCGRKSSKATTINNLYKYKKVSCICQDGKKFPNKFAFKILKKLNIDFEMEKYFDWCKFEFKNKIQKGLYDFYFKLDNKECILEMDGGFHNNDNNMNGQTSEESQYIDNEKDRLALEHGIEVIRIDCDYRNIERRFEYIKNNILQNDKLNELFDLNSIDWIKCNEFALSNLVKIACKYKKNNPKLTTTEIGKLMGGYNKSIICRWLKQGNGIWCNYNSKEEIIKNGYINGNALGKQVEIFKDKDLLGAFPSCSELDRQSEKLFGTHLDYRNISAVCNGKRKTYKGFIFRYVEENLKVAN